MQLFFVDESGSAPPPNKASTKYFIVGGVVIPEDQWHQVEHDLNHLKSLYAIKGEIKWRFFGQKIGREQNENNLIHLDRSERDNLRTSIFEIIKKYESMRLIATVTSIENAYLKPYIKSNDDLYWFTYKPLTEGFQYYLQDISRLVGSKINGIIICDHRERTQDDNIRKLHAKLLETKNGDNSSKYENLIEGLFLTPSHLSIGIQLADMVVGSIFRKFEHNDDRWFKLLESCWERSASDNLDGYGLVKFPETWK